MKDIILLLKVTSTINFKIKDMNEAPYDLQLNSDYSQFYFENNKPKVRENAQGKRAFLTYPLGVEICIHITQPLYTSELTSYT